MGHTDAKTTAFYFRVTNQGAIRAAKILSLSEVGSKAGYQPGGE
jgi:hypothetical protein